MRNKEEENTTIESYSLIFTLDNLKNEEWKDIPGYDGIYQCSNYGRIKTVKREYVKRTKYGYVTRYTKEIIRKPSRILCKKAKSEVLYISLRYNGIRKTDTVSQLVGITFIGEKKKGYHFQHKNKNTLDNRLINIEQVPIYISKSNDFKHKKRIVHNYKYLPKAKLIIIRDDGIILSYSEIVKIYGRSAYLNILKGQNVRNHKWNINRIQLNDEK